MVKSRRSTAELKSSRLYQVCAMLNIEREKTNRIAVFGFLSILGILPVFTLWGTTAIYQTGVKVRQPIELRLRDATDVWGRALFVVANLLGDPAIGGVVVTVSDATERKILEQQFTQQAFYDAITGLPNRVFLRDRPEHALVRAGRRKDEVGLPTGVNIPLGKRVWEEACRQVVAWHARFPSHPLLTLSVNLSPRQFQRPSIVADAAAALKLPVFSAIISSWRSLKGSLCGMSRIRFEPYGS
jgi:hypothetical protein